MGGQANQNTNNEAPLTWDTLNTNTQYADSNRIDIMYDSNRIDNIQNCSKEARGKAANDR